jgi:hypothetical protein
MAEAKGERQGAEARADLHGAEAAERSVARAAEEIGRSAADATRQATEKLSEQARGGMRQASAASSAGAEAALRTGATLAEGVQEITGAWTRYAEEVMRQTSEASRALVGCRSFADLLEIQARLARGNLQAFLDQSSKIAEVAGRIASRPFEAMRQVSAEPPRA